MRKTGVLLARVAALAATLSFAAGCGGDSTGPSNPADVVGTQAAVDAIVNQFFLQNPGVQSLQIFGTAITTTLPSVAAFDLMPSAETTSLLGMATRLEGAMTSVLSRRGSAAQLMSIPAQFLGTTFVFNPQTGQYEASTRTGAPANGVRFILYDDTTTLNEIGHLDIIDASDLTVTPAAIDITLSVVVTNIGEVLNYRLTGSASDTGGTLLANGTLSDGTDQLGFDVRISGTDATGFSGKITLTATDVTLTLDASQAADSSGRLDMTIQHGTDEILIVISAAADGTIQPGSGIFVNNTLVAVFSGNTNTGNIDVKNAQGNPLSQQELTALGQIMVSVTITFSLMEQLVDIGLQLIGVIIFFQILG